MLTTSRIAKAAQVCCSKAFVATQAMVATTMERATERRTIGRNFDLRTPEDKLSLQHTKRGYIYEKLNIICKKSMHFPLTVYFTLYLKKLKLDISIVKVL